MKLYFILIIAFFLNNCSFDNKTGIWKDESFTFENDKQNDIFEDFKTISVSSDPFKKTIKLKENFIFKLSKPITNNDWKDIFFSSTNNLINFKYEGLNEITSKSKKLTKGKVNYYPLYEDENLIISDDIGNLIIYSPGENKIISKFNFYKNKYKKIEKKLNLIVENNIIFTADNLGYVYAYNYNLKKVLWAKNFKIPLSSNLKIIGEKLIVSNQVNSLFFINKKNGNLIKQIPTEETFVKNQFVNNLSNFKEQLFFLNSYGSLYSIDTLNVKISWFINLNQSLESSTSNLFAGSKIINSEKEIIVSSKDSTYLIDIKTGSIIKKFNFVSTVKPHIQDRVIIFLTKNNFLIAYDINSKEIIYSYNLLTIYEVSKIIKDNNFFKQVMLLNNDIYILLKNSYVLIFKVNGTFKKINKLPSKIGSYFISIEEAILYLDNKNKLVVLN